MYKSVKMLFKIREFIFILTIITTLLQHFDKSGDMSSRPLHLAFSQAESPFIIILQAKLKEGYYISLS